MSGDTALYLPKVPRHVLCSAALPSTKLAAPDDGGRSLLRFDSGW